MKNIQIIIFITLWLFSNTCLSLDFNSIDNRIGEFKLTEVKYFPNPRRNESSKTHNDNQRLKCTTLSDKFISLSKSRGYIYFFRNELKNLNMYELRDYFNKNRSNIYDSRPFLKLLTIELLKYHSKITATQNWETKFMRNTRPDHFSYSSYFSNNQGFYQSIGFPKPLDSCYLAHMIISSGEYHYYQDNELNLDGFLYYFWQKAYDLNLFNEVYKLLVET